MRTSPFDPSGQCWRTPNLAACCRLDLRPARRHTSVAALNANAKLPCPFIPGDLRKPAGSLKGAILQSKKQQLWQTKKRRLRKSRPRNLRRTISPTNLPRTPRTTTANKRIRCPAKSTQLSKWKGRQVESRQYFDQRCSAVPNSRPQCRTIKRNTAPLSCRGESHHYGPCPKAEAPPQEARRG